MPHGCGEQADQKERRRLASKMIQDEEGRWEELVHQVRIDNLERLLIEDISSLATSLMHGLAEYCNRYVRTIDRRTKKSEQLLDEILAISWGLMALDPHNPHFASLLNSLLILQQGVTNIEEEPQLLLQLHRILPLPPIELPQERIPVWLLAQALDGSHTTLPPFLFVVEAAHLYTSPEPETQDKEQQDKGAALSLAEGSACRWPTSKTPLAGGGVLAPTPAGPVQDSATRGPHLPRV
jgi:hypothetical protein